MRRNVLAWLTSKVPNARHALVLTHNIDFLFVQSVMAPLLRRAGDPRLVVFADAACASQAFSAQSALLDGLGDRYRVVPVDLGAARRFHPKALLLSGPAGAALAIGSGNLTHGGMAANHEAWAFAVADGEGASVIAALRDYMVSLLPKLPLADPLRDWLAAVFDEGQAWSAALPAPAGLANSPAESTILDQIAAFVDEPIRSVEVIAPYHDEQGVALAALAARFAAPVTCWMQPGRAGLSRAAAEGLPVSVTLRSIDCEQERRPSFIHAKVLALRGDTRTVLAIGSANCSQAALLAGASWGNAELMVVGAVGHEDAEALFAGLVRGDGPPLLPETPPSEEWDMASAMPLRILAARFEAGRLRVAYRSPFDIVGVDAVLAGSRQPATSNDAVQCVAIFDVPLRPKTVSLRALGSDGTELSSAEAWVDDEASLSAPATLRRVIQRLRDDGDAGWLPARAFLDVLALFREYVCDSEAARRRIERGRQEQPAAPYYDPLAVFSEAFGRPVTPSTAGEAMAADVGLLAIVEALFAVGDDAVSRVTTPALNGDDASLADGDEPDPEAEQRRILSLRSATPNLRERAQLSRALVAVEQALRAPAFVQTRTPALLGADIALAAVLLVKGLTAGLLDPVDFRRATRDLWAALFFGDGNAKGTLTAHIDSITVQEDRERYLGALCSPRLSAALALWCATEWAIKDPDALWFRFSSALLYRSYPFLFGAASVEAVLADLEVMSATLMPTNERFAAAAAWVGIVRAGEALRCLSDAIRCCPEADLRAAVVTDRVGPSTLVWVNGYLGFPTTFVLRGHKAKAQVRFLGWSSPSLYFVDRVVPIRDLLQAGLLALPHMVAEEVGWLAKAAILCRDLSRARTPMVGFGSQQGSVKGSGGSVLRD